MRSSWCPGNCFFRAAGDSSTGYYTISAIPKAPQGAFTWHVFKIQLNSGTYYNYIDGTSYGGYGGFANSAKDVRLGDEITNNCSTVNTTYWGSPSVSSSYAFQYRTSSGLWTTWGSGSVFSNAPYHQQWLTYAIYQRTWGP